MQMLRLRHEKIVEEINGLNTKKEALEQQMATQKTALDHAQAQHTIAKEDERKKEFEEKKAAESPRTRLRKLVAASGDPSMVALLSNMGVEQGKIGDRPPGSGKGASADGKSSSSSSSSASSSSKTNGAPAPTPKPEGEKPMVVQP